MTQMDADGLNTAIKTYFDAIHECDVEKLDAVFHPQSSLFDADNGEIFVEPIDSFRADVAGRKSPQSAGQALEAEVLMIDFLSPLSAIVKIRIRAHHNIFVDHLGFAKGSSGWKIVSKIWHLEQVLSWTGKSSEIKGKGKRHVQIHQVRESLISGMLGCRGCLGGL